MKEIEIHIILYSYVIPTLIMFMFGLWQVYSKLRAKKKFVSYTMKSFLRFLIPGVSLYGVLILLLLFVSDSFDRLNEYINNYGEKQTN